MTRHARLAASVSMIVVAASCTDLRSPPADAVDGPDAGEGEDAGQSRDAGGAVDAEAGVEIPPVDEACADAWTATTTSCSPRRSVELGVAALDPSGIGIAVTPAGRVGIVTNDQFDFDAGRMVFVTFPVAGAPPTSPTILTRVADTGGGSNTVFAANRAAIAAKGANDFVIVAHDVDNLSDAGDILYMEHLPDGSGFTQQANVATLVALRSQLDVAVNPGGDVFVAYLAHTAPYVGDLRVSRRPAGADSVFTAIEPLRTNMLLGTPSLGEVSLGILATGQPHALIHLARDSSSSVPIHVVHTGLGWSPSTTVEGSASIEVKGRSPRLARHGDRYYALYFSWEGGQAPATASAKLNLATWTGAASATVEIVASNLRAADIDAPLRAALDVDRFGLAHIAYLEPPADGPLPDGGDPRGALRYKRQTRLANGKVEWREDLVDPEVSAASAAGRVGIAVDANVRPHIAYVGADGQVRYATRYDR